MFAQDSQSGVGTLEYAWTESTTVPATGWTSIAVNAASYSGSLTYDATENSITDKYLYICVTDQVGRTCHTVSTAYKVISQKAVNSHAPTISVTEISEESWTNDGATLEWKLENLGEGMKDYTVTLPDGSTPKASSGRYFVNACGTYTFTVVDNDYGGRNQATANVTSIDTTAPAVSAEDIADGWTSVGGTVTLTAADVQSGISSVYRYKRAGEYPTEGLTASSQDQIRPWNTV